MRKPRILVTSAAGRTGSVAVRELLRQGFPVRALVRRLDARAESLRAAGAEIVVGNLFDYGDLERALVGIQRAYHCPPFAPNLLHGTMLFAIAAEQAKLEVVAWMSGWNPHPSHPSAFTREHWITNQIVRWMPSVDAIYVNPGIFAYVYFLGIPVIVNLGIFTAPFGEGLNAPPSNEDIGRVAAAVLAHPDDHIGRSYRPTGPALISPRDAAAAMARVLGRRVTYRPSTINAFLKAGTALGISPFDLASIRHYANEIAGGTFAVGAPTHHVEELTGRPAEDFETIARRYFAEPSLVVPGLQVGSKRKTLAFLMKMMLTPVPDLDRWESAQNLPRLARPVLAHDNPEWRLHAEAQQLYLLPDSTPEPASA
ncbi:MAG TPA: NmrA family NAD(P)-binding protein [Gemmatimonadaceae bacterium]|nr:NmrA family NAD(P)-binding protein [Gemmatimonadaceae bacterium]